MSDRTQEMPPTSVFAEPTIIGAANRNGPTRLEDIAARVGVSRSEVSRVLNNRQREGRSVGRAKQDEIRRVARELNYQPNRTAQNLARGKTDTVALIVHIDSSRELTPHYHEIVGALTYTLNEWGLNLLLVQSQSGGGAGSGEEGDRGGWGDPSEDDQTTCLERLARARTCDAVIITDIQVGDTRPDLLETLGLPFIIRGSAPRPGLPAVGMDNAAVGYKAMEFLRRLGHRRILFHNVGRDYLSGQRRWEGMDRAAREFGLEKTIRYEDAVYKEQDMYALALRLAAEPARERPTAVFAADELAAFGVLRGFAEAGLRVPEDVSVLTCLNARFMRRVNPHLSFLNVRQDEVAAEAGRTLARMLRVGGPPVAPRQTFLSPILEEHGSCAPPPPDVR